MKEIKRFKQLFQLDKFEADVLQALETQSGKVFSRVKAVKWNTKMGFTVKNNRVTGIGLYECGLSTLPESIGNLKSLTCLNLRENNLTTLPESIGNLKSIKYLYLVGNHLTTLPESIGNLSSLVDLYLDRNHLTTLPESIGNLSSLKEIWLSGNELSTLPESIGNLSSLKDLYFEFNHLTTLPEVISNLSSLKSLWLNDNELTTLPESIGSLSSLQTLELGYNNLSTLPESIGDLKSLENLWLNNNQLSTLPESIGELSSLKELRLYINQLTALPESIGNLKSLTYLNLRSNQITTLLKSIKTLEERGVKIIQDFKPKIVKFKINKLLDLRLERDNTVIYVAGNQFRQCKYLLLNILVEKISTFDEIKSIDEIEDNLDNSMETVRLIPPEAEFWGHCSYLQIWAEYDYKTELLHRNLAFPLLKRLTKEGDKKAKKVLKKEIAKRLEKNYLPVILYLVNNNYLNYLKKEEILNIVSNLKYKIKDNDVNLICKNFLDKFPSGIKKKGLFFLNQFFKNLKDMVPDVLENEIMNALKDMNGREVLKMLKFGFFELINKESAEYKKLIVKLLGIQNAKLKKKLIEKNHASSLTVDEIAPLINRGVKTLREIESMTETKIEIRNAYDDRRIGIIGFAIKNREITELILYKANILTLPESMNELEALEILNCSNLENLPESICKLRNLKKLSLYQCNIKDLPKNIGNLTTLQRLSLIDNKIEKLPRSFRNLKNLKSLYLDKNELKHVPEVISELSSLQLLSLSENKIKIVPKSLINLRNLKFLDLYRNEIDEFPSWLMEGIQSLSSIMYKHQRK